MQYVISVLMYKLWDVHSSTNVGYRAWYLIFVLPSFENSFRQETLLFSLLSPYGSLPASVFFDYIFQKARTPWMTESRFSDVIP